MPSQNHTIHYGLTQYSDNGSDRVSFLGDYTGDMAKIDAVVYDSDSKSSNAASDAREAKTAATQAATSADKALTSANQASSDASAALSAANNAAATANTAKSAADTATSVSNEAHNIAQSAQSAVNDKENKGTAYPKDVADKRFAIWPSGVPQENMIILGDSISYGTGASALTMGWANMIGAERGSTVTNISANSAGFVNSPSFMSQLQTYSGDRNSVTHILIAGGANDTAQNAGDVTTAAQALFKYAIKNFPNARIMVIPCLLGFYGGDRYNLNIMATVRAIELALSRTPGVIEIPYGWEWLAGNERWSADYSINPNNNGHKELLRIISNRIDSQYSYRNSWRGEVYGANVHGDAIRYEAWADSGIYTVSVWFKTSGNVPAGSPFVSVSNAGSFANDGYVPNSANLNLYTIDNDAQQAHRCSIACRDNLGDGKEFYLAYSKGVAA